MDVEVYLEHAGRRGWEEKTPRVQQIRKHFMNEGVPIEYVSIVDDEEDVLGPPRGRRPIREH